MDGRNFSMSNHDEDEGADYGVLEPLNNRPAPGYVVRKGDRPYCSSFARQAMMLTLVGAPRSQLEDLFGVHTHTLQRWALEHSEFKAALAVEPVDMNLEDIALCHWFKDYNRALNNPPQLPRLAVLRPVPQ